MACLLPPRGGAARDAVNAYATTAERAVETGRGEGGDTALRDRPAAEDAIFAEIEALGVPLLAVSEERGELEIGDGGEVRVVVIDPVDGSLNAKRGLPFACVSIAIASGPRMGDVEIGWVAELDPRLSSGDEPRRGRDWWAVKGEGAFRDGERLPPLRAGPARGARAGDGAARSCVAAAASAIESVGARRIRALGSVAMTLCLVAAGQLDAMAEPAPDPLGRRRGGPAARDGGGRSGGLPGGRRARRSRCARPCWPPATRSSSSACDHLR